MSQVKYMDEEVIIKKAMEALIEKLGPVEALRFVNIPKKKRLESVKRHREWQKLLNRKQFLAEIFGS